MMRFLHKKIILQMKVYEAALWLAFYLMQSISIIILAEFATDPAHTPAFHDHLIMLVFKTFLNIILYLPLWWLFFYKLKDLKLKYKLWLHVLTMPLFSVVWTLAFANFMVQLNTNYRYDNNSFIWDAHATAIHYILTFSVMHAYNFWLHSIKVLKGEQQLKDLAYQSEIKALKSQIEPHFLFNTLNSISASVPPEMEKTRVMIAQLADTFRHALRSSEKTFVTLEEEMEFLRNWLSLEKHRFDNRLVVHFDLEDQIMQTQIPPMILQPLVENALNHGISPKVDGGSVTIGCKKKDEFVSIWVSDTGIGYKADLKTMLTEGIGLSNVYKRLQLVYNQSLVVERNPEGLRLSFKIPLAKAYEKESIHY